MSGWLPRFYPILDAGALAARGCALRAAAEAVIGAGARIVQLRAKGLLTPELLGEAEAISRMCRSSGVMLVVNDRADLALLVEAGLHIGQDDLPAGSARELMGGALIGLSTHNEAQVTAAVEAPVDYLAIGPVFETGSKENPDPVVGLEGVFRARRLTQLPLVAIGGIARENAAALIEAGADSVAVISDLLPEPFSVREMGRRAGEWMRAVEE